MPKEKVLELLLKNEQNYISGELISKELNVSRAAVCKDVKLLRAEGYEIESVTKRGYKLCRDRNILSSLSIKNKLNDERLGNNIIILDSITSTNTYTKMLAMDGAPEYTIVLAREQTGGRGRMGHSFESVRDKGIYMSVILRPQAKHTFSLTAYAAVALSKAIENVTQITPDIKWVNDLFLNGRKIAGILTEVSIEAESSNIEYVVLGFGLNVLNNPDDFDNNLQDIATSLYAATGRSFSLNELATAIINELPQLASAWAARDPEYLEYFKAHCITTGNSFTLKSTNTTVKAIDIDEDFRLIIEYDNGKREAITSL